MKYTNNSSNTSTTTVTTATVRAMIGEDNRRSIVRAINIAQYNARFITPAVHNGKVEKDVADPTARAERRAATLAHIALHNAAAREDQAKRELEGAKKRLAKAPVLDTQDEQAVTYTEANLADAERKLPARKGVVTKAKNALAAKSDEVDAVRDDLKAAKKGGKRLSAIELDAKLAKLLVEQNELRLKLQAAKRKLREAEQLVAECRRAHDAAIGYADWVEARTNALIDSVLDAEDAYVKAQADKEALCSVTTSLAGFGGSTEVYADESEARKAANEMYAVIANHLETAKIVIRRLVDDSVVAVINMVDGVKADDAAFASSVADTMPARPGKDGEISDHGRFPEWLALIVDKANRLVSAARLSDLKEGEDLVEAAEADGCDVVVFHNMAPIMTTKALEGHKTHLVQVMVVALKAGQLIEKEHIRVKETSTMRWLREHGATYIKYEAALERPAWWDAEGQYLYDLNKEAHEALVRKGVNKDGKRFGIAGLTSPNAGKDCNMVLTNTEAIPGVRSHFNGNAQETWEALASKGFAYEALGGSAVTPYPRTLDPEWEIIHPDIEMDVAALAMVVEENGLVSEPAQQLIHQISTDGFGVTSISAWCANEMFANATAEERVGVAEFVDTRKTKSGTDRNRVMGKRSFVRLINGGAQYFIKKFCGVDNIDGRPVDRIANFSAQSTDKGGIGPDKAWATEADRMAAFKAGDWRDRGRVLKTHGANPKLGKTGPQELRALTGISQDTFLKLVAKEDKFLTSKATTLEGIASLFPKSLEKAILEHPELLQIEALWQYARRQLAILIKEAAQCRFHDLVRNYQAAPDIWAWLTWCATGNVKAYIPAHCVVIPGIKLPYEGIEAIVTRSPIRDRAAMQIVRLYSSFEAAGCPNGAELDKLVLKDGVCYFSLLDGVMTALEMDFDGDHVRIIMDADWVNAVKELDDKYGEAPIVISKLASGHKGQLTKKVRQDYLVNRTDKQSVGAADNVITKIAAGVPIGGELTPDLQKDWAQGDRQLQAKIDGGKGAEDEVDFEERPGVAAAKLRDLPLGLAVTQAERRHREWPVDKDGNPREDWDESNMFDFVRIHFTDTKLNLKLDASVIPDIKRSAHPFQLGDAELAPAIYWLVNAPSYRWFKRTENGELEKNSTFVLPFDSADKADAARNLGIMLTGSTIFAKRVSEKKTLYAEYCVLHDEDNKAFVYHCSDKKFEHPVDGKYVINEMTSGLFFILESRCHDEWQAMIASGDEDQRKLVAELRANAAWAARMAIQAYAALYGFTLRDAYNAIVRQLTTGSARVSWFTWQFFLSTFAPEWREALDEGGVTFEEDDEDASVLDDGCEYYAADVEDEYIMDAELTIE